MGGWGEGFSPRKGETHFEKVVVLICTLALVNDHASFGFNMYIEYLVVHVKLVYAYIT